MAHYAKIDENGIVVNVIVAEQDVIDSGMLVILQAGFKHHTIHLADTII